MRSVRFFLFLSLLNRWRKTFLDFYKTEYLSCLEQDCSFFVSLSPKVKIHLFALIVTLFSILQTTEWLNDCAPSARYSEVTDYKVHYLRRVISVELASLARCASAMWRGVCRGFIQPGAARNAYHPPLDKQATLHESTGSSDLES